LKIYSRCPADLNKESKFWLTAFILIVAIIVVSSVYSYWERLPYAYYEIGDEIKGFPIDEISITVSNFFISPDLTFPKDSINVNLNLTIRNLSNHPIYFNEGEFPQKFNQATNKQFYIEYEKEGGRGGTSVRKSGDNWGDLWGITVFGVPNDGFKSLAANESVNGSMHFVLGNATYTSFTIICRSNAESKPLFIVSLIP